ncbi:tyrosine-type recombinase/integrase [Alcaligenes faecalis]|uniref:tyrosine-type recombinase/integrase n=1 Tax=Alcaligenes faecalis TaxID=511 RepID=UPI0021504AD8|nr:integrase arm-type DNA-binding domain-containing protein [Alcaligenes faecalis]MCR4145341.1 integrase arm-type DNA-binding domain-containing protein [Alcaligenes faecalis]
MPTNTLTDSQCRAAQATDKPQKLFDGGGLHLWISSKGAKVWRMAYRFEGKQKTMSFGAYPEVGLAEARRRRAEVREQLRGGIDPMEDRKSLKRKSVTLLQASGTYWEGRQDLSPSYRSNAIRGIEMHLGPVLGNKELPGITRDDLLTELMRVDAAGRLVYVRKIRNWVSQVFEWAVEQGLAQINPAALINPQRAFRHPEKGQQAALELHDVPELIRHLNFQGDLLSALACKLLALTWVRTKELRFAKWDEFEGDVWRVPAERMKQRRPHVVPLSKQAMEILEVLRVRGRGSDYVLASEGSIKRPISENAVLYLLYRIGYQGRMTGHGWRAVGSTWSNENGYNADVIEKQLAHSHADSVRAAYNRAEYLPQRREMLQAWADWLFPQVDPS